MPLKFPSNRPKLLRYDRAVKEVVPISSAQTGIDLGSSIWNRFRNGLAEATEVHRFALSA